MQPWFRAYPMIQNPEFITLRKPYLYRAVRCLGDPLAIVLFQRLAQSGCPARKIFRNADEVVNVTDIPVDGYAEIARWIRRCYERLPFANE